MTKIQLVFPHGGSRLSSTGVLPPVGITMLATYIKENIPDIEVEAFDGELTNHETIISKLDGDFLGISTTGTNYMESVNIMSSAKEAGMNVILGGPHATIKHKEILKRNKHVDAVIRRDGEKALAAYINSVTSGLSLESIKNISYRESNRIIVNPLEQICDEQDLNELPKPDFRLIHGYETYSKNFQKHQYRKVGYTSFYGMESQKGCLKSNARQKGRCTFCARIDRGIRRLSPKNFWKTAGELTDTNGKTMIWDFSDSFTGRRSDDDYWLEEVASTKPESLRDKTYFKLFARSDELTVKNVDLLEKIGVKEVFVGIESGDQRKLDTIRKGSTLEDNINAVKNLRHRGIKTYASFIYGFPGEDLESLGKTLNHAEEIMHYGNIAGIGVRCMFPLAGMPIHKQLINKLKRDSPELAKELAETDCYDSIELQKLWLDKMTNTNYDEILKIHEKFKEIAEAYRVRINDSNRLFLW